ncbi:uncharacterized protein UBRO_20294 [Ustilago bromivora]|uniref:Reverse transcriptase domain-containing protein n=1 Tax=Ustilago bromivora TaxID=307758 RepID=A0A1K0G6Y2_9BASI|nr:uncharacterized protein UBRO_20294 [Ustilago bromivora]
MVWESSLHNAFQPDASKILCLAGERKRELLKESITSYFYTKLSLLRAVFPMRQETNLLNEIHYGLPASLQLDVCTHLLSSPNMDDLLTELRNLEGPWKATLCSGSHYNSRNDPLPQQLTPLSTYSTPSHPLSSAVDTPRSETVNASNKFGLATNYDPANISYIDRDSRRIQTYKLPNSQQTITLGHPCRSCSQDHFDFVHNFLLRQPKGEAHIAHDKLKLTHTYGYSTICLEPVCKQGQIHLWPRYLFRDFELPEQCPSRLINPPTKHPHLTYSHLPGGGEDCNVQKLDHLQSKANQLNMRDLSHSKVATSAPTNVVFLLDPDICSSSISPLRHRRNPHSTTIDLPPANSTGSAQAFAGHIPTTAFVSLNSLDLHLSLINTGVMLYIIDEWLAHKLHLLLLQGPSIQVNGVRHDHSLGFTTLAFSIQGRKNDNPVSLHSSTDFHILSNFSPGILLGLDIICVTSMVIDVCLGRSHIQDISFPIYDTRGKTMSSKNVSCTLVVQNTTTILPHSRSFVHVCHNLLHNVQYTVDSSLWTTSDGSGPLAIPFTILDHNKPGLWVSNYRSTPVDILSDTRLAEALPLSLDHMAISAGSFGLNEAITGLTETVEWNSPVLDTVSPDDIAMEETGSLANPTSHILSAKKVDEHKTSHNPWPNLAGPWNCRLSFPTSITTLPLTTCKRSLSFDHHWPQIERAFTSEPSPPPSTSNDARPLNFTDNPLANAPTPAELDTVLVDDVFHISCNTQGKAHPSIVTVLHNNLDAFSLDRRPGRVSNVTMKLKLTHPDALHPEAPRRVSPDKRHQTPQCHTQYSLSSKYPLPHIDNVFQALRSNKFFSGLDTVWGYHQLDVNEEDHWKMVFVCHYGLFQYKRVPFGLKNTPAFFQCFMDHLLGHMCWTEALVYLDNVVVFSSSLEQHAKSLDCLLKAAHKVGLKFSSAKCHFALSSLTLLGRQVSTQGFSMLLNHTQAVQMLSPPLTLQDLYHLVGLFNYYQGFILNYAGLAVPLMNML